MTCSLFAVLVLCLSFYYYPSKKFTYLVPLILICIFNIRGCVLNRMNYWEAVVVNCQIWIRNLIFEHFIVWENLVLWERTVPSCMLSKSFLFPQTTYHTLQPPRRNGIGFFAKSKGATLMWPLMLSTVRVSVIFSFSFNYLNFNYLAKE